VAEYKLYGVEPSLGSYSAGERKSAVLNTNIHQHGPKIPPFDSLLGCFRVLCDPFSYCSLVCAKVLCWYKPDFMEYQCHECFNSFEGIEGSWLFTICMKKLHVVWGYRVFYSQSQLSENIIINLYYDYSQAV
jgi:hypothetical protein